MGLTINPNSSSANAQRLLNPSQTVLKKVFGQTSSGGRISSGADDDGGLAVSENARTAARTIAQPNESSSSAAGAGPVDPTIEASKGILQRAVRPPVPEPDPGPPPSAPPTAEYRGTRLDLLA